MILIVVFVTFLLEQVNCGHPIERRIINGQDSVRLQFPFVASIQLMEPHTLIYVHVCGGTVIDPSWILSTAVCVQKTEGISTARIVINMYQLENDEDVSVQIFSIADRIIYDYFNSSSDVIPHDIALVKLAGRIVNHVAAKIPEPKYHPHDILIMIGWGTISTRSSANKPKVLQYAIVHAINNRECFYLLKKSLNLLRSHMCTYTPGKPTTIGIGDAGGPVIRYVDGEPELEGIMSWTFVDNGKIESPTISTRISEYTVWIIEKTGKKPNKMSDGDDLLTPLLVPS